METIKILGVSVTNAKKEEALEFIVTGLRKKAKKLKIFTPNPEIIMVAAKGKEFKKVFNTADLALADGVGVVWAAKLLGKQLYERITGVDFMLDLCKTAEKEGLTVGFLGGSFRIAEKTAECLLRLCPKLRVAYAGQEWGQSGLVDSPKKILGAKDIKILRKQAAPNILVSQYPNIDILFVAYGCPKQERWIVENLPKIPVGAAMAVGGAFDYISGNVPRAPLPVRKLGLEWLFRLIAQPWRWRRQLALLEFIFLVLKTRFSSRAS